MEFLNCKLYFVESFPCGEGHHHQTQQQPEPLGLVHVWVVCELSDNLNVNLVPQLLSLQPQLDHLLYGGDLRVSLQFPLGVLDEILEDIAGEVHILGVKHVNVRVGNGTSLVELEHVTLG